MMETQFLIGLSGPVLIGILVWLCRKLIATRLTESVRHEFGSKLEALRAELRKGEEELKASLRAKEAQIAALRNAPLSGLASRQALLDKRKLEAVDQVWDGIDKLRTLKSAPVLMGGLKFDALAKAAAENPGVRQAFGAMMPLVDATKVKHEAWKARPYVTPLAWALFAAYESIIMFAVGQMHVINAGLDIPNIMNSTQAEELIKAALPTHSDYIEKFGPSVGHYLLTEIEGKLLSELQITLDGKESDMASARQASEIMKVVDHLAGNGIPAKAPG